MDFSQEALDILDRLESQGYEAWLVGGAVRDALFSYPVHDIDIATSAHPDQIIASFPDCKTVDVGKAFGTVRVFYGEGEYEVTTYRSESGYADKRHPDEISFSEEIEEDLKRRDFTMNAMAYHPQRGLLDPFGGQGDFEEGILRAVGKAEERINEDGLRMLRACRFAGRFSLKLDPELFEAIEQHADEIHAVSMERCLDEMSRMLTGPNPEGSIALLEKTGLFDQLFPEWTNHFKIRTNRISQLPKDPALCWAALFSAMGAAGASSSEALSKKARKTLKRWKSSRKLQDQVALLLREEDKPLPKNLEEAIHWKRRLGEMAGALLVFRESALLSQDEKEEQDSSYQSPKESLQEIERARSLLNEIEDKSLPTSIKELALSGSDLLEMGWKEGKELGETLEKLFDEVASAKIRNRKEDLAQRARKIKSDSDRVR